ncbi:MAG: SDR family oxidoreductase [Moraxellaceae bacterium]
MANHSLDGKVVWITGASRGIGAALAEAFAYQGARLVLSAPAGDVAGLEQTRQRCASPNTHYLVPFDLTKPEEIAAAHRRAIELAGRIDILVNNAGMTHRSRLLETSLEVDRRIMEVNYFGPVTLTKLVAPEMIRNGGGQVVTISSVLGLIATPQRSAYIAAKHALNGFFEALRTETADQGIAVTLVFPGFVNTDISAYALTGEGGTYGKNDAGQASAMSPEALAARVVAGVAAREPRLLIAGKERALVYLGRFSPTLVSHIVRRVAVT